MGTAASQDVVDDVDEISRVVWWFCVGLLLEQVLVLVIQVPARLWVG